MVNKKKSIAHLSDVLYKYGTYGIPYAYIRIASMHACMHADMHARHASCIDAMSIRVKYVKCRRETCVEAW